MSRILVIAATVLSLIASQAQAADVTVGHLTIATSWARATPKGASIGGGYMRITNAGNTPDRLVGGTSAVAKEVQIHEMTMDKGVMKMRPIAGGLEIKPGQTVTFQPGGYHLMFVGLKKPLLQGQHFKVTLDFAKAGKVDVDFITEGIGAMHPASGGDMPGMKMN
jgi:copper(I)-binding protein